MAICEACGKEARPMKYDDSFSHEFGVEERHHYGSDCCDADLYEGKCITCDGTGIVDFIGIDEKCDDCGGKGIYGLVDITCSDDLIDWDTINKEG